MYKLRIWSSLVQLSSVYRSKLVLASNDSQRVFLFVRSGLVRDPRAAWHAKANLLFFVIIDNNIAMSLWRASKTSLTKLVAPSPATRSGASLFARSYSTRKIQFFPYWIHDSNSSFSIKNWLVLLLRVPRLLRNLKIKRLQSLRRIWALLPDSSSSWLIRLV